MCSEKYAQTSINRYDILHIPYGLDKKILGTRNPPIISELTSWTSSGTTEINKKQTECLAQYIFVDIVENGFKTRK